MAWEGAVSRSSASQKTGRGRRCLRSRPAESVDQASWCWAGRLVIPFANRHQQCRSAGSRSQRETLSGTGRSIHERSNRLIRSRSDLERDVLRSLAGGALDGDLDFMPRPLLCFPALPCFPAKLSFRTVLAGSALSAVLCASSAVAQVTVEDGFTTQRVPVAAAGVFPGGFEVAPNGHLVLYDGTAIIELDRQGAFVRTVYSAAPTFGSFLRFSSNGTKLYFGESGAGNVYELAWPAGTSRLLGNVDFNYDCALDLQDAPFVSANPGFAGHQILRLDPVSGVSDRIASLPGASGPIAFDALGNLYAMIVPASFPPPPGSFSVIRFSAAQVQSAIGASELNVAQATTVLAGLDGGANFAFDGAGQLLMTTGSSLLAVDPTSGIAETLVQAGPSDYLGAFAFERGTTPFFRPYGAASGGSLILTSTDFFSFYDAIELTPARPALSLNVPNPVPAGPVVMILAGTAPHAPILLCVGLQSTTPEYGLFFQRPFLLGVDLASLIVLAPFVANAQGDLALSFQVPSGANGFASTWQGVVLDPQGPYASSAPLLITLQ